MHINLKYGIDGLDVNVPDCADVIVPHRSPGLGDEAGSLRFALRGPRGCTALAERVKPNDKVVVVFSDITRPMPSDRVLPVVLQELAHVPSENIVLLNALGTHQRNTPKELERMLGVEIVRNYRIEQHDAWDRDGLVYLGESQAGHPLWVNRLYHEATFRIVTGFIEPHIFAGFSGGPKGVLPGIAGIDTIMANHSPAMLNSPLATWGVIEGNPVWQEMHEMALACPPDFLVNVALNAEREITAVFAGEMDAAHSAGRSFVSSMAMTPVSHRYDVVLVTNSGYPLDINLYQTVKGMSSAARIVRPGGAIVVASQCRYGIPDYGKYRELVVQGGSVQGIQELISRPGFCEHDMWEAQLHAGVLARAAVHLYADGLSDTQIREMLLEPCHDIETTVNDLLCEFGPGASLCVLPEGPQTIPYLEEPCAPQGGL